MRIFKLVINSIIRRGVISTLQLNFFEIYFDLRYRIETRSFLFNSEYELGVRRLGYVVEYQPLNYLALQKIFRAIPLDFKDISFIDMGCGKGRVLIYGLLMNCQKAIGVEISKELHEICRRNLENFPSDRYDLLLNDVTKCELDDQVNLVFFIDPFGMSDEIKTSAMSLCLHNIAKSLERRERLIYIACYNTNYDCGELIFEDIQERIWIYNFNGYYLRDFLSFSN